MRQLGKTSHNRAHPHDNKSRPGSSRGLRHEIDPNDIPDWTADYLTAKRVIYDTSAILSSMTPAPNPRQGYVQAVIGARHGSPLPLRNHLKRITSSSAGAGSKPVLARDVNATLRLTGTRFARPVIATPHAMRGWQSSCRRSNHSAVGIATSLCASQ